MRKMQKLSIEYLGYKQPDTEDELKMELLGLETVIESARLKIATLRQSLHLANMMKNTAGEVNEKTIDTTGLNVK